MTPKPDRPVSATDRHEPQENARRFEHTIRRILSVPKNELSRREAEYKKARRARKSQPNP